MSSIKLTMEPETGDYPPRIYTFPLATSRVLTFTVADKDLSGCTVTINARRGGADGTVVLAGVGTIVTDAEGGVFQWVDSSGQLNEDQELDAQVRIIDGSGDRDYTQQFKIVVLPVITEGES